MTTASEPTPSRAGMGRVTAAFIAVPVFASLPFGVIAVVALPLMLILTALVMS